MRHRRMASRSKSRVRAWARSRSSRRLEMARSPRRSDRTTCSSPTTSRAPSRLTAWWSTSSTTSSLHQCSECHLVRIRNVVRRRRLADRDRRHHAGRATRSEELALLPPQTALPSCFSRPASSRRAVWLAPGGTVGWSAAEGAPGESSFVGGPCESFVGRPAWLSGGGPGWMFVGGPCESFVGRPAWLSGGGPGWLSVVVRLVVPRWSGWVVRWRPWQAGWRWVGGLDWR